MCDDYVVEGCVFLAEAGEAYSENHCIPMCQLRSRCRRMGRELLVVPRMFRRGWRAREQDCHSITEQEVLAIKYVA
jgi:hypothetical protein